IIWSFHRKNGTVQHQRNSCRDVAEHSSCPWSVKRQNSLSDVRCHWSILPEKTPHCSYTDDRIYRFNSVRSSSARAMGFQPDKKYSTLGIDCCTGILVSSSGDGGG